MTFDLLTAIETKPDGAASLLTAELARRVDAHMRLHYRVSLDELEQAETPGYWRDIEPKMHQGHPLHGCLGCSGPFRATYTYFDPPRIGGRFASRTRTWAELRANVELRRLRGFSRRSGGMMG